MFLPKIPTIVAEIGSCHNGECSLAEELIHAAVECGADAVKFQCYKASELIHPIFMSPQFERCLQLQFTEDQWKGLANLAKRLKIPFFASVFGEWGIKMASHLEMPWLKIASGDLNHLPLLVQVAELGKPVILSTGMGDRPEILRALMILKMVNPQLEVLLLHCISLYPTPPDKSCLDFMAVLKETFPCPIGFSDHTPGIEISKEALCRGAVMVEKHFTLTPNAEGGDHSHAATPEQFSKLVTWVREKLEEERGVSSAQSGLLSLSDRPDLPNREKWRRGIYASQPIAKGHDIGKADLAFLRPWKMGGISSLPVDQVERVLGPARRDYGKGEPLD